MVRCENTIRVYQQRSEAAENSFKQTQGEAYQLKEELLAVRQVAENMQKVMDDSTENINLQNTQLQQQAFQYATAKCSVRHAKATCANLSGTG